MNETPSSPNRKQGLGCAWRWPIIISGLLSVHAIMWLAFAFIATRDPSVAVEPDYYEKSLDWDATLAQLRRNQELGWSVEVQSDSTTGLVGDRSLVCRLRDREGKPIDGAIVDAVLFHHARGNRRLELRLTAEGEGTYTARPRMRKTGTWECRFTVRRGGQTFTHVALHEVSGR